VVAGREGIPPGPGGLLPSPLVEMGPEGAPRSRAAESQLALLPELSLSVFDAKCAR
jgi:hypothetical protein